MVYKNMIEASTKAIDLIQKFEGLELTAYKPTNADVWTIGHGTTIYPNGTRVKQGDKISKQDAIYFLVKDIVKFEQALNTFVFAELNQNEADALISFIYNVGITNFKDSTLLKKLNMGDKEGAAYEIKRWIYQDKKVLVGLVKRREEEFKLFTKKNYE